MLWCCWILPFNIGSCIKSRAWFRIPTCKHFSHRPPNNYQCKALSPILQRPTMEEEKFKLAVWCYLGNLWWRGALWIGQFLLAISVEENTWSWNRPLQRWRASGPLTDPKGNGGDKEGNMPYIQKVWPENHQRSKQKSRQLPWCDRTRKNSSHTPKHRTTHSMCIANQTILSTLSEIYRNQLTDGSLRFHPTKPCLTKL